MHQLAFGKTFLNSAKKLDRVLQPKLKSSLDFLSANPFHPTLRTKPLTGKLLGYYSLRLGGDYRVIFKIISSKEIFLLKVGHRKDIYR